VRKVILLTALLGGFLSLDVAASNDGLSGKREGCDFGLPESKRTRETVQVEEPNTPAQVEEIDIKEGFYKKDDFPKDHPLYETLFKDSDFLVYAEQQNQEGHTGAEFVVFCEELDANYSGMVHRTDTDCDYSIGKIADDAGKFGVMYYVAREIGDREIGDKVILSGIAQKEEHDPFSTKIFCSESVDYDVRVIKNPKNQDRPKTDILGNKIFYRITEDNKDQILAARYNGINSNLICFYYYNKWNFASFIMDKGFSIISCFNYLFTYIVEKSEQEKKTIKDYLELHKVPVKKEDWGKYYELERMYRYGYKAKKLYVNKDGDDIINIFKISRDRYRVFLITYLPEENFIYGCDIDTAGNVYYDTIDIKDQNGEYIKDENGEYIKDENGEYIKDENGEYIKVKKGCCYAIYRESDSDDYSSNSDAE